MNRVHAFVGKYKFIILPIIAVCVFFLVRTFLLTSPTKEILYTATRGNLVDTVQVSATYTTASQTQVYSPTNGLLTKLYVGNNQHVKKGEKLFYVESTATTDEKNAAKANYQSAISALQTAKNTQATLDGTMWTAQQAYLAAQDTQNYKNQNYLNPATNLPYTDVERYAIDTAVIETQKAFEAAEQSYTTADVAVSAAQSSVVQTKRLYDETQNAVVVAPAAGTVVNLLRQLGDQVSIDPQTQSTQTTNVSNLDAVSTPVLVITNPDNPSLTATISEDYALQISPGQSVSIVFDGLRNQTFEGTVQTIDTVGTQTQGVTTYQAKIISREIPSTIKPNMTALLTIETLRKNDVIAVPNSAILTEDGDHYVVESKTKKKIAVKLGTKGMTKTEIVDGISEGTIIDANPKE